MNTSLLLDKPESSVASRDRALPIRGEKITLHCDVDASPPHADVEWSAHGQIVTSGGRYEISSDQLHLTVKNLQVNDNGPYTCIASNEQGRGVSTVSYIMEVLCKYIFVGNIHYIFMHCVVRWCRCERQKNVFLENDRKEILLFLLKNNEIEIEF